MAYSEEGGIFSLLFHKYWVDKNSKDAKNTILGAWEAVALKQMSVFTEGTTSGGKVWFYPQLAVG